MKNSLAIRNNNPLNIRYSSGNKWIGQTGKNKGFAVFSDMVYGWRAAIVLLIKYQRSGYDTIRKIVTRWAPPSENDTEAYIRFVCHVCSTSRLFGCVDGDLADCRITEFNALTQVALAMSVYEIGSSDRSIAAVLNDACTRFSYKPLKK